MTLRHRKVALMGYRSVGKSSLAVQYIEKRWSDHYDPTVENTLTKTVKIKGQEYYLKLVDTAGQDEYSLFPTQYTLDVNGFCLVYSIDSRKSFEVVKILYDKLLDLTGPFVAPIILVGNKLDLQTQRAVSFEEGKKFANQIKAQFVEVSAKQNNSVNDLFESLILTIEKANNNEDPNSGAKNKSSCSIS